MFDKLCAVCRGTRSHFAYVHGYTFIWEYMCIYLNVYIHTCLTNHVLFAEKPDDISRLYMDTHLYGNICKSLYMHTCILNKLCAFRKEAQQ